MTHRSRLPFIAVCAAGLTLCSAPLLAQNVARPDRVGDVLRIALPLAAAAGALAQDDTEGLRQLTLTLALSEGSTALLKFSLDRRRPDGSGHGFPSGHASTAFAASAFVHKRYGLQWALPMYGLATFVGYRRVHTRNHFARDVFAGAAVGMASAFFFTSRAPNFGIALLPHGFAVTYANEW
ncbi:phosphatase PAP2 family protein [Ramlibacter sp.]|uniref:phosphatase PAP2 family protein n=1 Tax=Ramlibacter sp. TaxID=1917967 RepID=UPI003D0B733C